MSATIIRVRQAILDDVAAITDIYTSHIAQWEDQQGKAVEAESLNLYERWQHGGPWMARETCAVWIAHLLQATDGIPLVVEHDTIVRGYAEVFLWEEAPPYGLHLNISTLCVAQDFQGQGIGRALVDYVMQMAQVVQAQRVTVAYPHEPDFFEHMGFTRHIARYFVTFPVQEGRVFYQAKNLEQESPTQIKGWHMPLGRFQSAREEWERMRWYIWNGIPGLVDAEWQRLQLQLTGQPGILHLQQHRDDPGRVTVRLWTKHPITSHLLSAVGDRVARLGYERISTLIENSTQSIIGAAPAEANPQWLYSRTV